tara:strand:- start:1462 stop:3270 length:1809 start_codon:yes stop_codon:yes gene_type:complete
MAIQITRAQIKALAIDDSKLAGSISDSKLATISTSNKVSGSAVQLAGTSALENSTGLRIKSAVAGAALALSSQVLNVQVDDSSIEVSSDAIRVKASGITNAMLGGSIANAKLANSTISGVALGSNLGDLTVDNSSIQLDSGTTFNGSAGRTISIKASGVTNAMLAGSIANAKLSNSAVTVAGQSISLGGSLAADTLANQLKRNQIANPDAAVAMNSQKITGMADPTQAQDAATKAYVDSVQQGLDVKDACRVATTANITLSGTQTIDGVSVSADERVLVKNQSTASENGIYLCKAGSWARAADLSAGEHASGAFFFIEEGTVNADNGFVCTTNDSADTVGTHSLVFTQFSGAGQITAGAAMTKSGNTLNVGVDDSSIEVSSDALRVKASGITNAMLAGSINAAKLTLDSVGGIANAGGGLAIELDGSSLGLSSDGLKIADNGVTNAMLAGSIANAKLANSTISGKALGASLDALTVDNSTVALNSGTTFDGSAARTISIKAAGVGTSQLADDAVTPAKMAARIRRDVFTANGSTAAFDLSVALDAGHVEVLVYKNGLLMEKDGDSDNDSYAVSATGGSGGVGRVTFGANPEANDILHAVYIA